MNELFVFLEAVAGAGWVYLLVLAAGAIGLLMFDRRPRISAAKKEHHTGERMAA